MLRVLVGTVSLCVISLGIAIAVLQGNASATFPGSNGKIAFYSNRDGNYEIYTMNSDGTALRRLTNSLGYDSVPNWSVDGRRLVFTSTRDGADVLDHSASEIYVMNEDGGSQARLTTNSAADGTPVWSPNGTKIAFDSERDGPVPGADVFIMNADGSGQTRLTNGPMYEQNIQPDWSPDGSKILFSGSREGARSIFWVHPDGGDKHDVTGATYPNADFEPVWSPDGSKIVFVSNRGEPGSSTCSPCDFDIFVVNADGTGLVRLTDDPASDDGPAWSPDGSKIAFQSTRSGDLEIYLMNADGSEVTRLTNSPGDDAAPAWQPVSAVPPNASPAPTSTPSVVQLPGTGSGPAREGIPLQSVWGALACAAALLLGAGWRSVVRRGHDG